MRDCTESQWLMEQWEPHIRHLDFDYVLCKFHFACVNPFMTQMTLFLLERVSHNSANAEEPSSGGVKDTLPYTTTLSLHSVSLSHSLIPTKQPHPPPNGGLVPCGDE